MGVGAPKGSRNNPGGRPKLKPWTEALRLIANEPTDDCKSTKKLRRLAEVTYQMALAGDIQAIREFGNRLEGTPMQGIEISGPDGDDIRIIKRLIVDTKDAPPSDD